ncbi:MAG TPA: TonB-dependent receptor [Chitinophagaceae bacterium]|nr:TonB-dependent receptor [Chitinophagaceae bacterium]
MKYCIATCVLLVTTLVSFAQQKFTVNGYVKDSLTGETLIGANITFTEQSAAVATNQYGFYSITLPGGQHHLVFSYIGYQPKELNVNFDDNKALNVLLTPLSAVLNNVTVEAKKRENNVKTAQMGKVEISINTVKALPTFLGESDVLKSLQLLPGVRNAGEGNAGFYVRGGGADQNLILLDDAVVYNTGHLFGFFSVFNSDAIKSLSLIKGGMPAQYGGRLSSVIDIAMKDGNVNKTEVDAGIGLIASRFSIQGPIKKNKASYIISARRTYVDALTAPFLASSNFKGSGYYFYDLNAKINYQFSENDRLYLSGYFGRDKFAFNNQQRSFKTSIPWGNATGTLRWNHIFSKKLFANTTLVYNDYNFKFNGEQNDFAFNLSSGIRDLNAKIDFDYFASPKHKVKFGAQYTYHTFIPSIFSGSQDSTKFTPNSAQEKYANEYAVYIQDDWDINKSIRVNYGLRYSLFQQLGSYKYYTTDVNGNRTDSTVYTKGQVVKSYGGLEPRFTVRFAINDNSSIKAGITRNMQYIHLVSNAGTTLPTDIWVPSTLRVKPQIGWQYAAGYFRNFNNSMFETSVELYYKTMQNQIEYKEGYTPNTLTDPEESFVFGKGWSYGAEFFVNKVKGRFTGWVGYTLSWSWRKFPDLNKGLKYPSRYDRRHDLSVVGMYTINNKWKVSSVFIFGTGNAISLPERFYFIGGTLTQQYSGINQYRMKPYHRLDLSATYTPTPKKQHKRTTSWVFSIYNVYSRLNPYFYYFSQEGNAANGTLKVEAKQVSLFPIIPSVTWNLHF